MTGLPAHCPHCGHDFLYTSLIRVDGGAGVDLVLSGNVVSCPRCGRHAELMDGKYSITDGVLSLVEGPQATVDRFMALYGLVREGKARGEAPAETLAKVAALDPTAGKVGKMLGSALLPAYLAILLQVGQMIQAAMAPAALTRDDLRALVQEAVAQQQAQASPSPTPRPKVAQPEPKEHGADAPQRVLKGKGKAHRNQHKRQQRPRR